ncbi:MAG: XdhC family protein [Candidatus Caldarchaeum sp.]|uniref:XdhC family protein n=1 Tax=Caldiarchaeum subterraneum TaxID=311458 RepID=A0A7C5U3Q9_CALS0
MDKLTFYTKVAELIAQQKKFCIATVVKTVGHTSGKIGSKAIILEDGKGLFGWVGGGCVETTVLHEALKTIKEGRSRTIYLEMEDELRGTGVPCGGSMEVHLEPVLPKKKLVLVGHGGIVENLAKIGKILDYKVIVADPDGMFKDPSSVDQYVTDPDLEGVEIDSNTAVIVSTMHKLDHKYLKIALDKGAKYIGLIASAKRSGIVFETLLRIGVPEEQVRLISSPAGLDIGAEKPEEIALSIFAEIISFEKGGTGKRLAEVKASQKDLREIVSEATGERVGPVC